MPWTAPQNLSDRVKGFLSQDYLQLQSGHPVPSLISHQRRKNSGSNSLCGLFKMLCSELAFWFSTSGVFLQTAPYSSI